MAYDFARYDHTLEETAEYLRKLIQNKYDAIKAHEILKAYDLAYIAHAEQTRANNIPYIVHPVRVALMLLEFDGSITSKTIVAALLHDTLEDTNLQPSDIQQFGNYVVRLVQSVTIPYETDAHYGVKRKAKREKWQEIMLNSHDVRVIKTFEDLDNMMSWKTIPEEDPLRSKIPRWLEEASELSLPLARATNLKAYMFMQEEYAYYDKQAYAHQPITI